MYHPFNNSVWVIFFFCNIIAQVISHSDSVAEMDSIEPQAGVSVADDYGPYACKGMENNSGGGSGPRPFKVVCRNKKENASMTCNFNGNPHPCSTYNKNQAKFYKQLLDKVGGFVQNNKQCGPPTMEAKICPDIMYKIVR
ncbi:uncharacterized protein LOC118437805 [Folsomia candida]|uniref:uncharacterized protein LOC118437805 n=1 Tax=Folsomia candida TaxID=158441 RepID=UPI001605003A|nr:uncharacterized protein LOC118437805 [Folsomia candida]